MVVELIHIIALVVALIIGFFIGWLIQTKVAANTVKNAKEIAKKIAEDAEKEAKHLKREKLLEVKDEWLKKKQEFDNEVNTKKTENFQLRKTA